VKTSLRSIIAQILTHLLLFNELALHSIFLLLFTHILVQMQQNHRNTCVVYQDSRYLIQALMSHFNYCFSLSWYADDLDSYQAPELKIRHPIMTLVAWYFYKFHFYYDERLNS